MTQTNDAIKMKGPIIRSHLPRERREGSNIQTLVLTVIIESDVVAIVMAIMVLMIVEFCGGS